MSVGLKVTVYNESGAFLAAGWKKHSGYTLSGINVLENILTNLLGWESQYMVDDIDVTAESIDKAIDLLIRSGFGGLLIDINHLINSENKEYLKVMNMYNDELTSWQTGFGEHVIISNKYSNTYNGFISFFNDDENVCVDGSIDIYLSNTWRNGYLKFNVWSVYENKEELIDNIGIEDFNNLNFEVIPDDETLIQEPYELVHYKNYEKLLNTTKVMFYNRNNADNYYFKTKQGRYISLNA